MDKKRAILTEYLDYTNVFSKKLVKELSKCFIINKHLIDLELGKQSSYGLIYSLNSMELETLKTYIITNLANGFIQLSKSYTGAFILFI